MTSILEWHFLYLYMYTITIAWLVLLLRSMCQSSWFKDSAAFGDTSWEGEKTFGNDVAVASVRGGRPHMEDTYVVDLYSDDKEASFFGVYDGHGGAKASAFTAEHLHKYVKEGDYHTSPEDVLTQAFARTDSEWLDMANANRWDDGTTAVTVLICDGKLYCANAGDSRAVIVTSDDDVDQLSYDHKPSRSDERMRIEQAGGRIIFHGCLRVEGMLAVTRAIGDRRLKKYVTSKPEIRSQRISPADEFIVLASDGLWDTMSNYAVAQTVLRNHKDLKKAATILTEQAIRNGSQDNITVMIVNLARFRPTFTNTTSQLSDDDSSVHTLQRTSR